MVSELLASFSNVPKPNVRMGKGGCGAVFDLPDGSGSGGL